MIVACEFCDAPIDRTGRPGTYPRACADPECRKALHRAQVADYHRRQRGDAYRADLSERYRLRNAARRGDASMEDPADVDRMLAQVRARRLARRYVGPGRAA